MKKLFYLWPGHVLVWGWPRIYIMGVLTELAHNVGISDSCRRAYGSRIKCAGGGGRCANHRAFFPVATHSNISCCFWWRCASLATPCSRLRLPDASPLVGWLPASRMVHFCRRDRVIKKLSNPAKSPPPWQGWLPDDSRQFAGHSTGNHLSQEFSWRYTFLLIAIFNIAVMASVYF